MKVKVTIPCEMVDLNTYINAERANKFIAAKIKKEQTNMAAQCTISQTRGIQIQKPVDVSFIWYSKNKKKDPDGIAFAKKFILDGMVISGLLPQDSQRWIKSFHDDFDVDKGYPRVEITLEER